MASTWVVAVIGCLQWQCGLHGACMLMIRLKAVLHSNMKNLEHVCLREQ